MMISAKGRMGRLMCVAGLAAAGALAVALPAYAKDDAAAAKPQPAKHHFVKKGQGPKISRDEQTPTDVMLSAEQTDGRYTIQDEIWKTTFTVPPHFHKEHSETFYMLDGQLEWTVNGETQVIGPGDLLYIPPDTVHSVRVVGGKDAHVLFIYEPGGYEKYALQEQQYTEEERKKPEIQRRLMEQSDFNLAPAK